MLLRKRRGVTLLITLSVIAAMVALMGVLFGYLETARMGAENKAATIQANLLRDDLHNLLRKYVKKNPSQSMLQRLYDTTITIDEQRGGFGVMARCEPLLNRIPLTWLGWEEDPKHQRQYLLAKHLFDSVAESAEIHEPERLYEMIVESLKGRHLNFGMIGRLTGKKGSMGPREFKAILDDYRFALDDPNVYRVHWKNYFRLQTFGVPINEIDKDFLTAELVAYLFDQDLGTVKEGYAPGDLSGFLGETGEEGRYRWLFRNKPPLAMHCTAYYRFRDGQYNVKFDYLGRRIENFELQKQ